MNLADGIIRAHYRNGFEHAEPLEPDKTYAIAFSLFPTSKLFQAGHRIRVDLSTSNYPTYDPNRTPVMATRRQTLATTPPIASITTRIVRRTLCCQSSIPEDDCESPTISTTTRASRA
jgi:predicted acyl esterase